MPNFKLYYDELGKVICYTSDNEIREGNYIEIDAQTYAESRPDVKVIDGKIVNLSSFIFISKLIESNEGIICEPDDVCVISDSGQHWKVEVNEFRNS